MATLLRVLHVESKLLVQHFVRYLYERFQKLINIIIQYH